MYNDRYADCSNVLKQNNRYDNAQQRNANKQHQIQDFNNYIVGNVGKEHLEKRGLLLVNRLIVVCIGWRFSKLLDIFTISRDKN